MSLTSHPLASRTTTPSTSTAQSPLLSAMSVESLPHYTVPNAAENIFEDPTTAEHLSTRSEGPRKAPTQTKITEFFRSTASHPHKPALSEPQNTLNPSPNMHLKGKASVGVHSVWICRETSGFGNPTQAASLERWNSAEERESEVRWSRLPRINSWDMTKSHVTCQINCFDPIGNGFGICGKIGGPAISFGATQSEIGSSSTSAPHAINSELEVYNKQLQEISRENLPNKVNTPPMTAVPLDDTPSVILPLPSSQYSGGIGNYGPVPSGLIAAATKAQHNRKSSIDRRRQTPVAGEHIDHTPGCPCSKRQAVRDNAVEICSYGEAWNWCGPGDTPASGLARYLEEAWAAIKNGEPEPGEPSERKEAYIAMAEAWESWKVRKRLPPPPLSMRSVLSSGNAMDSRLLAFGGSYNARAELVFIDPVVYAAQLKEKQRLKESGGSEDTGVGISSSSSESKGGMLPTMYYEAPNLDPDGLLTAIPGNEPKDFKAAFAEYKRSREGMSARSDAPPAVPRTERSEGARSGLSPGLEALDIEAANASQMRTEREESHRQKKRQRALQMAQLELDEAKAEQAEKEARIKGTHLPLRTTKGNALGLRFSQARNSGFGERSGVRSSDAHEQMMTVSELSQQIEDGEEAHEHLAKQEADFKDRELQKSQQDWRECNRLRWTKNSRFGLGDRGMRDKGGSPKPSAEYYLKLGSAARNMNKAISPIVDAGGFEEDMSTAWLMTSPLSAHATPGSAEFRKSGEGGKEKEGKEYFGVSTHATPRTETPRSGEKSSWKSKQEEEDELALVNVSPIAPKFETREVDGDDRLLKWNGEIISRLGKGVAQEIRVDTPPPPVQLTQLPPQGLRSAAEERRWRRRMERKQSGSAGSTPAPSAELMQQEWIKAASPKV